LAYDYSEPLNVPQQFSSSDNIASIFSVAPNRQSADDELMSRLLARDDVPGRAKRSESIADVTDGKSTTILPRRDFELQHHWLEPRDLPIEELEQCLNPIIDPTLLGARVRECIVRSG